MPPTAPDAPTAPDDRPAVPRLRPSALEVCVIAGILGMVVVAALTWAGDHVAPSRPPSPNTAAP